MFGIHPVLTWQLMEWFLAPRVNGGDFVMDVSTVLMRGES